MSEYGIVGDANVTDLPETSVDNEQLVEEKKMAKYSKTAEFKQIKDYMEARIEFWKLRQPNGTPMVAKQVTQDMVNDWVVANHIIAEFQAFLSEFENASKAVEDVQR
jgi:hypothetical protein